MLDECLDFVTLLFEDGVMDELGLELYDRRMSGAYGIALVDGSIEEAHIERACLYEARMISYRFDVFEFAEFFEDALEEDDTSTMLDIVLFILLVTGRLEVSHPARHHAYCPWIDGCLLDFVLELGLPCLDTVYLSLDLLELVAKEYLVYLTVREELEECCSL